MSTAARMYVLGAKQHDGSITPQEAAELQALQDQYRAEQVAAQQQQQPRAVTQQQQPQQPAPEDQGTQGFWRRMMKPEAGQQ